jgi:hypothetical protein
MGLAFTAAAVFGGLLSFAASMSLGMIVVLGIGVVQVAWIVPMYLHFKRAGEMETAKGLLIAAAIVFLLNAGCWGLVVMR